MVNGTPIPKEVYDAAATLADGLRQFRDQNGDALNLAVMILIASASVREELEEWAAREDAEPPRPETP